MKRPSKALQLTRPLEEKLRQGHPWVFRDALVLPKGLQAGQVVDLHDRNHQFIARGTVEPDSPLTFRTWTLQKEQNVDTKLLRRRLEQAAALRRDILAPSVTGYRLCHGENDYIPGLQCDMYDRVASLRTDGQMGVAWEERFVSAVSKVAQPRAIVVRNPRVEKNAPRLVFGEVPDPLIIDEGTRRFLVHVFKGQKTGFFLDQRVNRDRIAALAKGKRVLNLFAYTGGFSIAAALGGAAHTVTVDISKPAIETAKENFRLNKLNPDKHGFEAADAFDVLADAAKNPGKFDIIIVDPPSFAPSRKLLPRALRAYEKLNEFALQALEPGGWLATASCSSHVHDKELLGFVMRAAQKTGKRLALTGMFAAGPDHPVRLGFPEGQYLHFLLGRVVQ